MISTNRHRIGFIIALATASYGLSPAIAQQGEQQDEKSESLCDVDFPGGTLSEYVDAVRKACPVAPPSIVVMPEALGLHVSPIKLVAVTTVLAMEILDGPYATDNGLRADVRARSLVTSQSHGKRTVLAMKVVVDIKSRNVRSAVWSVEEALIYGQTAEKLLEAVEAAMSLFRRKAEISYHPPTGLLIVRGEKEQLALVRALLREFIGGAKTRHQDYRSLRDRVEELEAERVGVTAQIHIAQKKIVVGRVLSEKLAKMNGPVAKIAAKIAVEDIGVAKAEADRMISEQKSQRLLKRIARLLEALKRYETDRE